jgi:hypothetical protein
MTTFADPAKNSSGVYIAKCTETRTLRINCVKYSESLKMFEVSSDALESYKEPLITKATECSQSWFSKQISQESLTTMYDDDFDALFDPEFQLFDADRNEISPDDIKDGTVCDILVELDSIWFVKKSFGPRWRVLQARVLPVKIQKKSCLLD